MHMTNRHSRAGWLALDSFSHYFFWRWVDLDDGAEVRSGLGGLGVPARRLAVGPYATSPRPPDGGHGAFRFNRSRMVRLPTPVHTFRLLNYELEVTTCHP